MELLISQCSSKMLLDVRVHHRTEVIKLTVPEQIDDEHLDRDGKQVRSKFLTDVENISMHQCFF